MSTAQQLREHINVISPGIPFLASSMRHLAPAHNLRKILERMVTAGELKRVTRGMFIKPKKTPYVTATAPSAQEVVETISQSTGEIIAIHGAEAARRFQLSTQTPIQPIFYTSGNTRKIKAGKQTILLKHISPRKMIALGTRVGEAISALWYVGKENVTLETIHSIQRQLTQEEFIGLLKEANHMPAWMANIFFYYQKQESYV